MKCLIASLGVALLLFVFVDAGHAQCAHCGPYGHAPAYGGHHSPYLIGADYFGPVPAGGYGGGGCCAAARWGGTYRPFPYGYGPPSAMVYPYYTIRGPRDFLLDNPPSIGP